MPWVLVGLLILGFIIYKTGRVPTLGNLAHGNPASPPPVSLNPPTGAVGQGSGTLARQTAGSVSPMSGTATPAPPQPPALHLPGLPAIRIPSSWDEPLLLLLAAYLLLATYKFYRMTSPAARNLGSFLHWVLIAYPLCLLAIPLKRPGLSTWAIAVNERIGGGYAVVAATAKARGNIQKAAGTLQATMEQNRVPMEAMVTDERMVNTGQGPRMERFQKKIPVARVIGQTLPDGQWEFRLQWLRGGAVDMQILQGWQRLAMMGAFAHALNLPPEQVQMDQGRGVLLVSHEPVEQPMEMGNMGFEDDGGYEEPPDPYENMDPETRQIARRLEAGINNVFPPAVRGGMETPSVTGIRFSGLSPRFRMLRIFLRNGVLGTSLASKKTDLEAETGLKNLVISVDHMGITALIPRRDPQVLPFRDIDWTTAPQNMALAFPVGMALDGTIVWADLASLPHLIVGGTTGSGKSIFAHTYLDALLLQNDPEKLRLVLVDAKQVELPPFYEHVPHLACRPMTTADEFLPVLQQIQQEMDRRNALFRDNRVRDLGAYRLKMQQQGKEGIPYLLVHVDEFYDLLLRAKQLKLDKELIDLMTSLAQMGRAAGIHLCITTQSPKKEAIPGLLKANVPARMAFQAADRVASQLILDADGAEDLLKHGDGIWQPIQSNQTRIQSFFLNEEKGEISAMIEEICRRYPEGMEPMFEV